MGELSPDAAARSEAQRPMASAAATAARRQAVAVSPAIGPLPAICVPADWVSRSVLGNRRG